VNYIVVGSVSEIGGKYVINVRLINVESAEICGCGYEKCWTEPDMVETVEKVGKSIIANLDNQNLLKKRESIAIINFGC